MTKIFFYVDVDECVEESDRCAHNCQNTEGSYTCNCSEGFLLDNDGYSCIGTYAYLTNFGAEMLFMLFSQSVVSTSLQKLMSVKMEIALVNKCA